MQHLDDGSLQAWLDRDRSGLEDTVMEDMAAHLEACPECAARAEELDALTQRMAGLLSEHAGGERIPAYHEVRGRARALDRTVRGRRWTRGTWAASVAVALGAGWLGNEIYRSTSGTSGTTSAPAAATRQEAQTGPAAPATEAPAGEARGGTDAAPPAVQERLEATTVDEAPAPAPAFAPRAPEPTPAPVRTPPASVVATAPVPPAAAASGDAPPSGAHAPLQATADASPPDAPRDPVVRGRVVDAQSGQPVPAAQVYIADLDVGVLTLPDGSFRLPLFDEDVANGPLTLTVQRIGYRTENRAFTANPGDTVTMDFRVAEEALQLDEVIVTGTPGGSERRSLGNAVTTGAAPVRVSPADPAFEAGGAWSTRTLAAARSDLGFAVASVPDLSLGSVEVGRLGGMDAARVRQPLGGGAVLTLLQARAPLSLAGGSTPDGRTVSMTRRGDVTILGAAAVPLDSLDAILSRVR